MTTGTKWLALMVLGLSGCSGDSDPEAEDASNRGGDESDVEDTVGDGDAGELGSGGAEMGADTDPVSEGGRSSGTGGEMMGTGGEPEDGGSGGSVAMESDDPACDAARYCEDFESYDDGSVPGAPWSLTQIGDAELAVDSSNAFAGNQSLRVLLNQSDDSETAYLEQSNSAAVPVPSGNLFGRVMVYRTPAPTPEHHFWMVEPSGGGTSLRLGGLTPNNATHIRYYLGHEPSHSSPRTGTDTLWDLETGEWSCFEWQFDTNADETRVWLNGEPLDSLTQTGWDLGDIDTIKLGQIMNWAPAADQEIWFDQFAIDEKRIPCPTPSTP